MVKIRVAVETIRRVETASRKKDNDRFCILTPDQKDVSYNCLHTFLWNQSKSSEALNDNFWGISVFKEFK